MKLWLGIDPGKTGGATIIGDEWIVSTPLPMVAKTNLVDVAELHYWVDMNADAINGHLVGVVIEKAHPMPKMGAMSAFNFGSGWGALLGMAGALGWPHSVVAARSWRKKVLVDLPHDKDGAVTFVCRTYPSVDLRPGQKWTAHDGMAESVCIAHYCRHHSDFAA